MPLLSEELDFLYGLMREGMKFDLDIMRAFSEAMGHPEEKFKSIHVAGTNGKGSTSAIIYNILRQSHSTGLYTSPHLVKFNERILIDREQIDDNSIIDFIREHKEKILELSRVNRNPTFFETTTMMAFQYFANRGAEYASVEVGLGGRLDSTNIVKPEISVITQVGYEHADKLGCSLTSIATEKGGIIKEGVPVVLADEKPEVVGTIEKLSSVRNSPILRVGEKTRVSSLNMTEEGTSFVLETPNDIYSLRSSLIGDFQVKNIATAVLAAENSGAAGIGKKEVERGVAEARWPGRMEIISSSPKVILDSSHNPPAVTSLVRSFRKVFPGKPLLVVGMLSDKDSYSYLTSIRALSDEIIFTSPKEEKRAWDPEKIDRLYGGMFRKHRVIKEPIEAYDYAKEKSDLVLVTGSMYLVGLIKEHQEGSVMPFMVN